jgi:hypothetical protein
MSHRRLLLLALLPLLVAMALVSTRHAAFSAPDGAAKDLAVDSQSCVPGFKAEVVLKWTPSGIGTQWVDFSLRNDGFTEPYFHGGPLGATVSQATLNNLEPQRNYYVRVSTWNGSDWVRSDLFAFTTGCLPYEASPPTHVAAASISDTAARFSWVEGNGNLFYCIDYAETPQDLVGQGATWRNAACGTTDTEYVVEGLHCGRSYFARIWSWTTQGGRYSAQLEVTTQPCATTISQATNLRTLFLTPSSTRLAWDPGIHNIWYCVDLATSQQDLLSYGESWKNYCGTTEPELELTHLKCETVYYWRVYTWNFNVNAMSVARNFVTADCDLDDTSAHVLEVNVHKSEGAIYRAEVQVQLPNGCQTPGFYRINRNGNKIEITIKNLVASPLTVCAQVAGTHLWTIRLGTDFAKGVTYEVRVNNELSDFFTPD